MACQGASMVDCAKLLSSHLRTTVHAVGVVNIVQSRATTDMRLPAIENGLALLKLKRGKKQIHDSLISLLD